MIHTHTVHTPWVNPSIRFLILPSSTLSLFALATILPSVLLFSSFFDPRLPQSNLLIFPLLPVWTNSLLFTDQFLALSSRYPLPFLLFKSPTVSFLFRFTLNLQQFISYRHCFYIFSYLYSPCTSYLFHFSVSVILLLYFSSQSDLLVA